MNPIEFVWNSIVQRLKKIPLNFIREIDAGGITYAVHCILELITHDEVRRMYKHSGLMID